jgi:serine/threonine protein kinase
VLEYAIEGNLRDYLKKNFTSLKWNDKIQMALDITSGLKFLHSKEIIHRDLVGSIFFFFYNRDFVFDRNLINAVNHFYIAL